MKTFIKPLKWYNLFFGTVIITMLISSRLLAQIPEGWNILVSPQLPAYVADIAVIDGNPFETTTMYTCGVTGTIRKSTDGGTTWVTQTSGVTFELVDIDFHTATTGWAVGYSNQVLRTTDGGSTWSAVTVSGATYLLGVKFATASIGWAVGTGGKIYKSTNGGASWTAQTSNTTADLNAVATISSTTAVAVGNNGTVCRTSDGSAWGATTVLTATYNDVSFSGSTGYAVGAGGKIIKSINSGSSWTSETSGTAVNLYGVSYNGAIALACGASGTIVRTTTSSTWSASTTGRTDTFYGIANRYYVTNTTQQLNQAWAGGYSFFMRSGSVAGNTCQLPGVTMQSTNLTACSGSDVSIVSLSSGTVAKRIWKKNGSPVSVDGVTDAHPSTLQLTGVTAANAGTYLVEEIAPCGSSTSTSITLTVNTVPAQPSTVTGKSNPTQNIAYPYSVTNVGGTTYTWSGGTGSTVTGSGNAVNISWANTGANTVTVTPSNTCGSGTTRTYPVNILAPMTTPTLSPLDNATGVAVSSNLTLTFSTGISLVNGKTISIKRTSDNSTFASYTIPSANVTTASSVLTINPSSDFVNSIGYYVLIDAGAVESTTTPFPQYAGIGSTTAWSFTTAAGADVTPPTISTFSPLDNATNLAVTSNLVATFSENVTAVSTKVVSIKRSSDNVVFESYTLPSANVYVSGATVTINPTGSLLNSTGYYISMDAGAFEDAAGNDFAGIATNSIWNFTTEASGDITPPTVTSFSPLDGATGVSVSANLIMNFSENITAQADRPIYIQRTSDDVVIASYTLPSANVVVSGSTVTINPTNDLPANTSVYVIVGTNAFRDAASLGYAGILDKNGWNFTTGKLDQTISFGALPVKTYGEVPFGLSATATSGLTVTYSSSNTSVATVSGNAITIVGAGSTTITASQAGDGTFNPASNVQQTLTVNKANQTIAFGALAAKTFGDAPFGLSATATSGLTVSYSSSNPAVATVSGSTVTIVGVGSTTITASQAGNTNYNAATNVLQTLIVGKANQTITFGALAAKQSGDAPFALTASATSGLTVSYSSSNTAVATVSGSTVTIVGVGTTTITASQAGNTNYNAATPVNQSLTVSSAIPPVAIQSFSPVDNATEVNGTSNLTVTLNQDASVGAGTISVHRSDNDALITSLSNFSGSVIINGASITFNMPQDLPAGVNVYVNITAGYLRSAADPSNTYGGISDKTTWNFTVAKQSQSITFGTLAAKTFGEAPFALTATASSGLAVSYSSSNPAVATVSGSTVTIVGVGSTIITASQTGNESYHPATNVQQSLTVNKANQTITFGVLAAKTFGDTNFTLNATATSGLAVSYSSSNTAVATVSGNTVTIVGAGSTTITASQAGNTNYNAATNVLQTLTVNKANQTITFGALASKIFGDANFTLSATASSSLTVSYSSSNPAVATVSGNTVTIVGTGSTIITASQAGNANYNAATNAQQTLTVNKANQTITFGALASKIFGDANFTLSATASSSLTVSYSSSNPAVATVSGNTVIIIGAGSTIITASQAGNTNYNAATNVQQTLTVNKANQSITFSDIPTKTVGDPNFTLTASTSSGLAISFSSSNPSVATVSGNTVTVVGAGSTIITASQAGNANYNAATSVDKTLVVSNPAKQDQTITFGALPGKTFGDDNFALTASASSGLAVSFSSSNSAIATVSGSTVTIVSAGSVVITANQGGDGTYNPAPAVQQTLTVNKANQTITFSTLPAKTFGDANFSLTGSASSGLPVSYSSSNPSVATVSGSTLTIIGAGTCTITATQGGNANYNSATPIGRTLTVNKAGQTISFGPLAAVSVSVPPFSLNATASSNLTVSYSSSNTAVATVSGNTVTIVGQGSTTITASQSGNVNYNAAVNVQQTLEVIPQTRTIGLSGTMSFGESIIGVSKQEVLTISNSGNSTLTITNITYPSGFSGSASSGVINSGATMQVTVKFDPTEAIDYSGNIVVTSNAAGGTNEIAVSGSGILVTAADHAVTTINSLYPNPVATDLMIEVSGVTLLIRELVFYDMSGKNVLLPVEATSEDGKYSCDLRNLKEGIYMIAIPGQKSVKRIVKIN